MFIRKVFYRWMLPAAAILPAWLLIGWAAFGPGGWEFLLVLIGAFVLMIGLLVVSGIMRSRAEVRSSKAVGAADAVVLGVWHALIIGLGFQGVTGPWLLVGVVFMLIGAFWFGLWELLTSAKRGLETALRDAERLAYPNGGQGAGAGTPRPEMPRDRGDSGFGASADPNVIIVRESPRED